MRAFEAKLSDRDAVWAAVEGAAGEGAGEVEKGFEVEVEVEVEKGFAGRPAVAPVEKGFTGAEAEAAALTPNNDSPSMGCGAAAGSLSLGVSFCFDWCAFSFSAGTFEARIALKPLTLPSFLLHAFLLQAQRYSRRSWPGKRSGRSPFNCSSKVKKLLQFLHFAR